jgi:hypothetical protein
MPRRYIMKATLFTVALAALLTRSVPSVAGIVDSPLPELVPGEPTYHVYSVPSVVASTGLGTFFGCTSTDAATMQVGVELFGGPGGAPFNDAVATSLSVAPGATVIFGTGAAVGISISSNVGGFFSKGSARILATSRKVVCTAWVADTGNAPPTSSWQLNIVAKTKQKGD